MPSFSSSPTSQPRSLTVTPIFCAFTLSPGPFVSNTCYLDVRLRTAFTLSSTALAVEICFRNFRGELLKRISRSSQHKSLEFTIQKPSSFYFPSSSFLCVSQPFPVARWTYIPRPPTEDALLFRKQRPKKNNSSNPQNINHQLLPKI